MDLMERFFDRHSQARDAESLGKLDEAIKLYEQNISEGCLDVFPYEHLSKVYHNQKRYRDEIRVLERGIYVFRELVPKKRVDRELTLSKLDERLYKTRDLIKQHPELEK